MSALKEAWQEQYELARETMPEQDAENYAYKVLSPCEVDHLNGWIDEQEDKHD